MKVLVFKDIKNKRWTIWSVDRKTHMGYADKLVLKNCSFIVEEEKRQKVLKSGSRFPHAWIVGEIRYKTPNLTTEVFYNPFKNKQFKAKGKNILKSEFAVFNKEGKVFV